MADYNLIHKETFKEYKERFKNQFILERKHGIISVRMHSDSEPVLMSMEMHNAWPQLWYAIGTDPKNEAMILTSTGDFWLGGHKKAHGEHDPDESYMISYDAMRLMENMIFDLDFPTIAAINGPGIHTLLGLVCDITICSEDAIFQDPHFMFGVVPGDGQGLAFQAILGMKRAAYYLYTSKNIDAQKALEFGLVSEVVPKEKLMDRAWELAEEIMKQPRVTRRLTSQLVKRPWKRVLVDDMATHFGWENTSLTYAKEKGIPRKPNAEEDMRKTWEKELRKKNKSK